MCAKLLKIERFQTLTFKFYLTSVVTFSKTELERFVFKDKLGTRKSTKMTIETFKKRKFIILGLEFYVKCCKVNNSVSYCQLTLLISWL